MIPSQPNPKPKLSQTEAHRHDTGRDRRRRGRHAHPAANIFSCLPVIRFLQRHRRNPRKIETNRSYPFRRSDPGRRSYVMFLPSTHLSAISELEWVSQTESGQDAGRISGQTEHGNTRLCTSRVPKYFSYCP